MASINGISVKSLKKFKDHEGEDLFQGTLYLNNKKIGFWSQDSWGGPDHIDLLCACTIKQLNQAVIDCNPHKTIQFGLKEDPITIEYSLDLLLSDYIHLTMDEKDFKAAQKAGYVGIVIATDGFHKTGWRLPKDYAEMSDEELLKELGSELEDARKSFWKETDTKKHKIKIYRSLSDFEIGEPIKMENIVSKKNLNQMIEHAEKAADQKSSPDSREQVKKDRESR